MYIEKIISINLNNNYNTYDIVFKNKKPIGILFDYCKKCGEYGKVLVKGKIVTKSANIANTFNVIQKCSDSYYVEINFDSLY